MALWLLGVVLTCGHCHSAVTGSCAGEVGGGGPAQPSPGRQAVEDCVLMGVATRVREQETQVSSGKPKSQDPRKTLLRRAWNRSVGTRNPQAFSYAACKVGFLA